MRTKTAKGLHLWHAKFGYTTLLITTRLKAPQLATKRAQQAAKDQGIRDEFRSIEYSGTIDA